MHSHWRSGCSLPLSLALADLHVLTGAVLLHQAVLPAAGLGALAAIATAARHVAGQQAAARHAHAHSAMDKGFQLQILRAVVADLGNFGQGSSRPAQRASPQLIADLGAS